MKARKYITRNTRARSTRRKIQHGIPDRIPHAEIYNTKYQSAFHMQKNIIRNSKRVKIKLEIPERILHSEKYNTRAHSTRGKYITQNTRERKIITRNSPRRKNNTKFHTWKNITREFNT